MAISGWDAWPGDYDEYGYFQGKGRKGKGKGMKSHGPQDQGKGQGDGKGEANYVNPSHSSQPDLHQAATFVSECLWFLCDAFPCVLDISQDERE